MYPQHQYNPQCDFTYLYCCKCTYDSHCVYRAFYVLDALYFGSWAIQILFYIGGPTGLYGLIGLPFAIIFAIVCGIAIRNLCKFRTDLANKEIQQRTTSYEKWRLGGIGALAVGGILLAIIYYVAIKSSYEKAGWSEDDAKSFALTRLVNTIISYGISIIVLFGYRPSLLDSTKVISMSVGGATIGGQPQLGYHMENQPVYIQQPQFMAFAGQGRPIGAPAQPMYMPSPSQGYNPPPPIVPLQMNQGAAAPAPYRPPQSAPTGPRAEGSKPSGR